MSSSSEDRRMTMMYATRAMSEGARRLAGQTRAGSPEHDFYAGVASAADAHQHRGRGPAEDPGWLERQTPVFRDGYLKASAIISAAAGHPQPHLLMPSFEPPSRPPDSP